ncbi:hypothetical protein IU459_35365 [Nocardia amamiensis]|uniref:Uncharacterized protein n=1 Tax=Nocardia amamiensis TaxID=404578 RepID=A0ABS0D1S7_9NOCA|nr:hypothetical protein [Nocardia amamiensis]MBF6302775.1 hypothetical protein [Nocardia amamiensis]
MSETVDEVAHAFGPGILHGVQVARAVTDLVRGLNAEQRSALESQLRIAQGIELHDAKRDSIAEDNRRKDEQHDLTLQQRRRGMQIADEDVVRRSFDSAQRNARGERETAARVGNTRLQSELTWLTAAVRAAEFQLRVEDSAAENARKDRVADAQVRASNAREDTAVAERGIRQADHERRIERDSAAEQRETELHTEQISGYKNRDRRSKKKHKEEVAEIRERRAIRRRTAGFEQTLTGHQQEAEKVMAAAGQFAAGVGTGGLSDEHADAAKAWGQRLQEDTGLDPDALRFADNKLADIDPDLAQDLSDGIAIAAQDAAIRILLEHLQGAEESGAGPGPETGERIGDAVADVNAVADPAAGADLDAGAAAQARAPEQGAEPGVGA